MGASLTALSTDGSFLPWSRDLQNWLSETYPLPESQTAIPDEEFLEPRFILKLDEFDENSSQTSQTAAAHASVLEPAPPPAAAAPSDADPALEAAEPNPAGEITAESLPSTLPDISKLEIDSSEQDIPPALLIPIPESETFEVKVNKRITPASHFQDVRHLELTFHGDLKYQPGDTLTIYPKNFPSDVSSLIDTQGWADVADKPLRITPNPARTSSTHQSSANGIQDTESEVSVDPALPSPLTVRNLLLHTLDLNRIPSRCFLSLCSQFTSDSAHKERLSEFADPKFTDEYYDYVTRPRRSVVEVLADFDTVKLPWRYLLTLIPRMRGRQFSIASSYAYNARGRGEVRYETTIDLLVALVMYRTVLRKIRQGTCSRYLASLDTGTKITCTLTRASWDVAKDGYAILRRPILAVAAGTGVAPMRALFQERAAAFQAGRLSTKPLYERSEEAEQEAAAHSGKALLVFGNRNREADYFYADEWPQLGINVHTAWSRKKREKVYVQDIVRANPLEVWSTIGPEGVASKVAEEDNGEHKETRQATGGGGTLFICGSSGKMPVSVRAAVVAALQRCGLTEEAAELHLKSMEKSGKLIQETW